MVITREEHCMNDSRIIIDAIEIMKQRFSADSTVLWVTATGKPELFVRDHLGAIIAEHNADLIASREWNKHDLALLDENADVKVLIEGKHLYDFDLHSTSIRGRYRNSLLQDLEKMKKGAETQNYVSLLMTSIRTPIPNSLARITKYSQGINKGLKKYGSELMEKSVFEAREFLSEFGEIVMETEIANGHSLGLNIHLWMWLVKIN
jgi:hypothetical protein